MNNVFRILNLANATKSTEKLFHLLTNYQFADVGGGGVSNSVSSSSDTVVVTNSAPNQVHARNKYFFPALLKPSQFTIAELVRTARAGGSTSLAVGAVRWGVRMSAPIPMDVLRDAMSFLYRSVGVIDVVF